MRARVYSFMRFRAASHRLDESLIDDHPNMRREEIGKGGKRGRDDGGRSY